MIDALIREIDEGSWASMHSLGDAVAQRALQLRTRPRRTEFLPDDGLGGEPHSREGRSPGNRRPRLLSRRCYLRCTPESAVLAGLQS